MIECLNICLYTCTNICVHDGICRHSLGSQGIHSLSLEYMEMWHCGGFVPVHNIFTFLCISKFLLISQNTVNRRMSYFLSGGRIALSFVTR